MTPSTPLRRARERRVLDEPMSACQSRLAECITQTQKDLTASFLPAPIVGHVGDGNFHVAFVLHPSEPREMAEAERLSERVVHRALSLEGTCTGEHGIGCGKMDFLIAEHGEAVSVMCAIKKAIDPRQHYEPGKNPPGLIAEDKHGNQSPVIRRGISRG